MDPNTSAVRYLIFLYPWVELLTLIQLGIETSAILALGYVFLTICIGSALIRRQGLLALSKLREMQPRKGLSSSFLADDLKFVIAGLLLFVPGLVSDIVAVVILVGPLRRQLINRFFDDKYLVDSGADDDGDGGVIIDGSFTHIDEASPSNE